MGSSSMFSVVQFRSISSCANLGMRWHGRTSLDMGMIATLRRLLRVEWDVGGMPVTVSGERKGRKHRTYMRGSEG